MMRKINKGTDVVLGEHVLGTVKARCSSFRDAVGCSGALSATGPDFGTADTYPLKSKLGNWIFSGTTKGDIRSHLEEAGL